MIGLTWDKWASVERQPLVFSGFDLVEDRRRYTIALVFTDAVWSRKTLEGLKAFHMAWHTESHVTLLLCRSGAMCNNAGPSDGALCEVGSMYFCLEWRMNPLAKCCQSKLFIYDDT